VLRFLFLLLVTFSFLNAVSLSKTEQLEKVSLQLHWKYQFEFAGFIAAKEKGFYEDVGLDVELKEYDFGIDIESDVISGKSEYGIYNSLSLVDYLKGKPLKLVASFFKRAALVLVTTPDIKSPKDLVGKTIMATTKEDFILNYKPYFDMYGVDIDDLILVPHTYSIDEFVQGKVSAMTAFISNEVNKLNEQSVHYNILDPSDDNLFVLQLELFTSSNEANNHPDRVQAFKKASIKGWEYALKNQDEIVRLIYDKYTRYQSLFLKHTLHL
jgi:ABC-type nitrate/sulfonate/bicarbonate transport system substrate-binding protein